MTIYTQITPTYLYIKQHSITGLKYFGKTTKKDPYKYKGSGTHWTRHIKLHGKEHIVTLWVSELYYDTSIIDHALHFSIENNIIESTKWANLKLENGLDGGGQAKGSIQSIEHKAKISAAHKGKTLSVEHKAKISSSLKGIILSSETRNKMSAAAKGKTKPPMSDETRAKMSAANKGKTRSAESRAKQSNTTKGKTKPSMSDETRAKISATLKKKKTLHY